MNIHIILLKIVALIGLVLLVYWAGLRGPFILDDLPNLEPMAYFGGVVDLPSVLYFVSTNESGPLGRPLSMLSFLINDHSWPSDPFSFKYTNLLIHIINGLLVYWLLLLLAPLLRIKAERGLPVNAFAFLGATLWVLHPMHVSSVLYVVQRMTLLSSLMILVGMIAYLKVRCAKYSAARSLGLLVILGGAGIIGLLFKETAALLVIYVLVTEEVLFRRCSEQRYLWPKWDLFRVGLWSGAFIFIGGMIAVAANSDVAWGQKGFLWWQRLLSEQVILLEYLKAIVLPRAAGTGLFHDDWRAIESFSELAWALTVFCCWLIIAVVVCRVRRLSFLRLPIFWFLGGHILESTILPLELYFEHRNYLPMLGVLLGLGLIIERLPWKNATGKILVFSALGVVYMAVTYTNVIVWSDEKLIRNIWAKESPTSIRAQQFIIGDLVNNNELDAAAILLDKAYKYDPNNHHLNLQKIIMQCMLEENVDVARFTDVFSAGERSNGVYNGLLILRDMISSKRCSSLELSDLDAWVAAFMLHPGYQDERMQSFLFQFLGVNQAIRGSLDSAMEMLDMARQVSPTNVMFPLTQAYWLADAGLYQDASSFIDIAVSSVSENPLKSPMQIKLIEKAEHEIRIMKKAEE